jgi:hypothetical protein
MRKLSFIILSALVNLSFIQMTPSPHGKDLKVSCTACHSTKGWKIDKSIYSFDHNTTALRLEGQHNLVDCKSCHPTLVFSEAKTGCIDCHTDMHSQTVGPDCARCHTPISWLVENITEIHQRSRFPLVGKHYTADCSLCHKSESLLRFDPLGVECYDCHQADYNATTNPNHVAGGYSTNCNECHLINAFSWTETNFNHSTFPLTGGHSQVECSKCHINGNYSTTSKECVSCHQSNYDATTDPKHSSANFPLTCEDCHTTNPGWQPAQYKQHDSQFPIYSGKHNQQWNKCSECHPNSGNYAIYTCTTCHAHNQQDMNDKHSGVNGYQYNDAACLACHPTGSAAGGFDHNTTKFPLTGGHTTVACSSCHTSGYAGTSTVCSDCHTSNYNQTTNPNHTAISIPNTCETCHTTNPGWKPATFPTHDNYYPLTGAHATNANNCDACHNGNYNNTPKTCDGCHMSNYNQTTNPNHSTVGISTACADCHTTNPGWKPATFTQHNNYYPLTGAHSTIPTCEDCHKGNYNSTPNTCDACHLTNYNQTTNPNHNAIGITTSCETCHTTNPGWKPAAFPTHNNYYVIAGAHVAIADNCAACHNGNYTSTPNTCEGCHMTNYNQTTNPAHASAQFPTNCEMCHTQNAWTPSTFNHDGQYFPIYSGKHLGQWTTCADCHTNPANYAVYTCLSCHAHNQTDMNDSHSAVAGYSYTSSACYQCHPAGTVGPRIMNMKKYKPY